MRRFLARTILTLIILITLGARLLGRFLDLFRTDTQGPYRVAMIGTFYNVGWLVAHATPLVRCEDVDEVLVVCDEPLSLELDGLIYTCPTRAARERYGRSLARVLKLIEISYRFRPKVYIGYHIMPNGPLARIMASIFGGAAIYQMTGGPVQVAGGGPGSENPLLAATESPSVVMEGLMFSLVRSFDTVIVRGHSALDYVRSKQLAQSAEVVTGAIDVDVFRPGTHEKETDVLYVARLIPGKGHKRMVDVIAACHARLPEIRVHLAGDGDLDAELRQYAGEKGVADNFVFLGKTTEIPAWLQRTRCWVLLSDTEGMSIALLEAMGAGVPCLVTDVGDLRDAVRDGETGVLVNLNDDPAVIANRLVELLTDEGVMSRLGENARNLIRDEYSMEATAERWHRIFRSYE